MTKENLLESKWFAGLLLFFSLIFLADQNLYSQQYRLGDIPLHPEIYKKHLKAWPLDMAEALPSSYDAREFGLVTTAKDQGACGSCWAFASVGAMESHMLKMYQVGPKNLSEQQQVSCNVSMWGCDGGSSNAIRYWELKGPLDEGYFPYTADDATSCQESEDYQLDYRVIDWHTVAASDFKNSLYSNGPSYWRYDVYSDFYTYWSSAGMDDVYINSPSSYQGGHAILIIGWDDSKGAYLCKNSWGETGGPNGDGTFWIAYSGHVNNLRFGMANFSLTALTCSSDAECDDGVYCNGEETCVGESCQEGTPRSCLDDGLFCNGDEVCNEATPGCGSTGDPCGTGFTCNENTDQCDSLCGNGICDEFEDCTNCSVDCISGSSGGTCDACFKGQCDGTCHPVKEGAECSDCWTSYCCGDGACEGAENNDNCQKDCPLAICGDGICDSSEDPCYCAADCGPYSIPETNCTDGIDNDCDGSIDGDDSDCPGCKLKKEACSSNSDCCSNRCIRDSCK